MCKILLLNFIFKFYSICAGFDAGFFSISQRRIQRGEHSSPPPPPSSLFFCNHLLLLFFFCNYFEELQTVLFEVELIINYEPLTYVYPNTIETYLTPNHLLFGRQVLYSSNTTSAVVRSLTVLSNTTDKMNRISNYFMNWWRYEFT